MGISGAGAVIGDPKNACYDMASEHWKFLLAAGQDATVGSIDQIKLYKSLIDEEVALELMPALNDMIECSSSKPRIEVLREVIDGCVDSIYVILGLLRTIGVDPNEAFAVVHGSNMTKVDKATGLVRRREDGKILKGPDYVAPDLLPVAERAAHKLLAIHAHKHQEDQ